MQYLAELLIENYCMSDIGLTTYAQPQGADTGYREGKPDVSELFEQQQLVASSVSGLLPPMSDMKVKVEVASSPQCSNRLFGCALSSTSCSIAVSRNAISSGVRLFNGAWSFVQPRDALGSLLCSHATAVRNACRQRKCD